MSSLIHSTGSPYRDGPRFDLARDLPMSISGRFTVAVAGDIVITRPIGQLAHPEVVEAIAPFQRADLAIGNLEQTIADRRTFAGHPYGVPAFLIMAEPSVARDLAKMGFRLLGRANNRLSDFGVEGNRETDRHLREAGIQTVGFGEHLADARAPAYVDLPQGRVGAVSATTHVNHGLDAVFGAAARVGLSNGRPGANSIRVSRTIVLPEGSWTALKDFVSEHLYAFPGTFAVQSSVMVYNDKFQIGNDLYVAGHSPAYRYEVDADDLRALLRSVTTAATYSDFTVCFLHGHQWAIDPIDPKGGIAGETSDPPDYLSALARKVIDAGADIFCMTGPFDFRAVEIYRAKPIFYGLGSFLRQAYMQEVLSWESYRPRQFGGREYDGIDPHSTDMSDAEILLSRAPSHPGAYFESATATCMYDNGVISEIMIEPIDLSLSSSTSALGIPKRARGQLAQRILDRISRNCAKFGTTVRITADHRGIIKPDPQ